MPFTLPPSLRRDDDAAAVSVLTAYYRPKPGEPGFYTGSLFDTWDSTGTRNADGDRFTADDLVAVTFLSVQVAPSAAYVLLHPQSERFSRLLAAVGPDRDLAEIDEVPPSGWRLQQALRELEGVGPTIASKLFARKRPRLRPIYDTVVAQVTTTTHRQWEPLHHALRAEGGALQARLTDISRKAELPPSISVLRVLDVIAWMDGRSSKSHPSP